MIGCYLIDLLPAPPTGEGRRPSFQVGLQYVVTAWNENVERKHQMLCELLSAAMAHPRFIVELGMLSAQIWSAFGLAPRPAFMIRLQLELSQKEAEGRRILQPMELRAPSLGSLEGILVGRNQTPISGALVELMLLRKAVQTNHKGEFRFSAVPIQPLTKRLRICARGFEKIVEVEHHPAKQKHRIHLIITED